MKNVKKMRMTMYSLLAILFVFMIFPFSLFGQAVAGPIDEIRIILSEWYATEAMFLAAITSLTEITKRLWTGLDGIYVQLVAFFYTLIGALIGFFLDIGIFAEMGIVSVIWFVVVKTFSEIGFFEVLRSIAKSRKSA